MSSWFLVLGSNTVLGAWLLAVGGLEVADEAANLLVGAGGELVEVVELLLSYVTLVQCTAVRGCI